MARQLGFCIELVLGWKRLRMLTVDVRDIQRLLGGRKNGVFGKVGRVLSSYRRPYKYWVLDFRIFMQGKSVVVQVAPASFETQILGLPTESAPTKMREVPAVVFAELVSNKIQPIPKGSLLYPESVNFKSLFGAKIGEVPSN